VLCCDTSPARLRLALRNAAVYGVAGQLHCVLADWTSLARALGRAAARKGDGARRPLRPDAVFLSPPWGGPDYALQPQFDLAAPLAGGQCAGELLRGALALAPRAALFMPRTADSEQLLTLARRVGSVRATLENGLLNGKLKAKTLYCTASQRSEARAEHADGMLVDAEDAHLPAASASDDDG
jgi:trimethylguanosine synthase